MIRQTSVSIGPWTK